MQSALYRSFDALPRSYNELMAAAGTQNLYFGRPWFDNLIQTTLDEGDELLLFGVEDDGGNARALLVARRRTGTGLFQSRTAENFTNFYTMIAGPVLWPKEEQLADVLSHLVRSVRTKFPSANILRFPSMDPDTAMFPALKSALSSNGFMAVAEFGFVNWYEPCRDISYAAYVASLSSKTRNLIGRRTRKLEREFNVRWTLTDGGEGFDDALSAYRTIYDHSWKIPESYPEFIAGFLRACAETGTLRLGILYVDDKPAAAQIWTITNDEATIYKLAYDEKFKNLSVGSVLTAKIMEHVLDVDKPHTVDFGFGDDPYKKDWTRQRRERMNLIGFRTKTLLGALAAGNFHARRIAASLRDWLRKTDT
jgi:ribosomal protein S18 acetylase RimI-like enzyme